jgi:hypothetical protein
MEPNFWSNILQRKPALILGSKKVEMGTSVNCNKLTQPQN